MPSRKVLWFIGLALLGVIVMSWWASRQPARVAIINQAGPLRSVTLFVGTRQFDIGELRRGNTRTVVIPSGQTIELRYTSATERTWRSLQPIAPAQAVVLYIRPNERVEMRGTIGQRR